jgi:VWFA-related protein
MNITKIIRFSLASSLILLLSAIGYQSDRTSFLSSPAAFAQGTSQSQQPPLPSKSAPQGGDQGNPKGKPAAAANAYFIPLQVLVTESKGNALTGLKRDNFTIYEDNVKQEIISFSPTDDKLAVVILVEYSNNISSFLNQIWSSINTFIGSLRKGDIAAIVGYDRNPTVFCEPTQDQKQLSSTLTRFRHPNYNESKVFDALFDAFDQTQNSDGKVAILLIGTGLDSASRHNYDQTLEKCKSAKASVYPIGLGQAFRSVVESRGKISDQMDLDLLMGEGNLKSLADYSGGTAYFPRSDSEFPDNFKKITELLQSQYGIVYSSTNTKNDGKFRKIRVDVSSDQLDNKGKPLKPKVVTRKGYTARQS